MKKKFNWLKHESGEVLILVLVLMAVGALILTPLLANMGTALRAGLTYDNKAKDFYAADSGIEDGLWRVKNGNFTSLTPTYDIYGFDKLGIHYAYAQPLNVNSASVNVTIDNIWIPKDYTPASMGLSVSDLHSIIEDTRLIAAGSVSGQTQYKVSLAYNYEASDAADPLKVTQIGVWLPPGFTYNTGSCNIETIPSADRPTLPPTVSDYAGGTIVVWKWTTPKLFTTLCADLGGDTVSPNYNMNVLLNFTPQVTGATPNMVPWIYTGNSLKDIKFAWDADVRIFKIHSVASGGTDVSAYGVKVEQRSLAKTIAGDYVAIGGTNLISSTDAKVRDTPVAFSSAITTTNAQTTIPGDAEVAAAYLYWSGWYNVTPGTPTNVNISPLNPDTGSSLGNWSFTGTAWSSDGSKFAGHYTSGGESAKYITLTSAMNLSSYAGSTVIISWQQWVSGSPDANDRLYLSISNDGGLTWSDGNVGSSGVQTLVGNTAATTQPALANFSYTIPNVYLNSSFKVRFYLQNFTTGTRKCLIDNITILPQIINDTCDADTLLNWTNGGDWSTASSGPTPPAFIGHDLTSSSSTSSLRYITLSTSKNLTVGQTISVALQQWAVVGSGSYSINDRLYVSFSSSGGSSWSTETEVARGSGGTNFGTAATPVNYSTTYTITSPGTFKIRFRVYGFTTTGRNVYVDNVVVTGASIAPLNPETCSNLNNWTVTGDWKVASGTFQAQDLANTPGSDPARYLTLTTPINLSSYAGKVVNISWQQWATGSPLSSDKLQLQFWDGSAWGNIYTAAQGNAGNTPVDASGNGGFLASQPFSTPNPSTNPDGTQHYFSLQIPNQYLTSGFKMRFYLAGFGATKYCYIDNIYLNSYLVTIPVIFNDAASIASPNPLSQWISDVDWTGYYSNDFAGTHTTGNRYLTLAHAKDLSDYVGQALSITWNQSETGSLTSSDGLQYQFSGDGGNTWSMLYTAFTGNITSGPFAPQSIPSSYITSTFKVRFYLLGFGSGKVCHLDDIQIYNNGQSADPAASLKINGIQVSFDANGLPQQGAVKDLFADKEQIINNADYGNPHGYSYSSFKDVTALVRAYSPSGANGNKPGNATYTVGGVGATSNADDEWQYAGWSMVIIYTSAATLGHQLYLYDTFLYCDHQTDLDVDQDGHAGGTISGFLVPAQILGETNAAKITAFAGEGDDSYAGDFLALNAPSSYASHPADIPDTPYKLWDGTTSTGSPGSNTVTHPDNVWDSKSVGLSASGIDVDTFNVPWASGLIHTGDTTARIDMYTDVDIWNLVYVILSFRSLTTSGGSITYLIRSS